MTAWMTAWIGRVWAGIRDLIREASTGSNRSAVYDSYDCHSRRSADVRSTAAKTLNASRDGTDWSPTSWSLDGHNWRPLWRWSSLILFCTEVVSALPFSSSSACAWSSFFFPHFCLPAKPNNIWSSATRKDIIIFWTQTHRQSLVTQSYKPYTRLTRWCEWDQFTTGWSLTRKELTALSAILVTLSS
jgi:hypothetical protein